MHMMFLINLMETTKHKYLEESQKSINQSMYFTIRKHQIAKENSKRGRQLTVKKTKNNKVIGFYLSIINLDINGWKYPIKRESK